MGLSAKPVLVCCTSAINCPISGFVSFSFDSIVYPERVRFGAFGARRTNSLLSGAAGFCAFEEVDLELEDIDIVDVLRMEWGAERAST